MESRREFLEVGTLALLVILKILRTVKGMLDKGVASANR